MDQLKQLAAQFGKLMQRVPTRQVDIALAVLVTLAGLLVFSLSNIGQRSSAAFGFLQNMELGTLDARFQIRGPRPHDDRVVIIGIDERTLQKVGSWPISRSAYADMVDRLSEGGASVVSFDVTFPTPEKNSAVEALRRLETELAGAAPAVVLQKIREIQATSDNDLTLAEAMQRAGNVILGHIMLGHEQAADIDDAATEDYIKVLWGKPFPQMRPVGGATDVLASWRRGEGLEYVGIESNIGLLAEAARSYGFFNNNPDGDGTMRRAPLLVYFERGEHRDFFPSLAFQTLREYENIKDQSVQGFIAPDGLERIELGPYVFHPATDGTVLINFTGPYKTYAHYSMADVIDGTVPAETFKDKIVLLGATAVGIGDLRSTPFGKQDTGYMGVEIHANVIDNMLNNEQAGRGFIKRGFHQEISDLLFILLFGLGAGYWFGRTKPLYATLGVAVLALAYSAIAYFAFASMGMWLSFVIPVGTLVVNYASITSFRMIFEEREKRKIRRTFGTYVSPGVIALIEKDPQKYFTAGGESKEMSVFFSDIRSFTTISEGMTAEELVTLLNEYLGEMTDILFRNWGTLDKYIGDAIMGFWNSPYPQDDHATRACRCALEMGDRLDELNLKWESQGKTPLSIGIGINTGVVNVGNMGSSKRLSWTVMGDNVNLASRLEGLTKNYHARIVIGEGTYAHVKDQFVLRPLDKIRVKGKLQPINIYEVLDHGKNAGRWAAQISMYNDALAAYRRQQWDEAAMKFETLLAKYPQDGVAEVLLERAVEFRKTAPAPDWDGVYVFTSK